MSTWFVDGKEYGSDAQNIWVNFGEGKSVLIRVKSDYCLSCLGEQYRDHVNSLTQEEREAAWAKIVEAFDPVFPKIGVRIDTFGGEECQS